jgi:hypothetical protein
MPSGNNGGGGGRNSFLPARAKLWIGSLDTPTLTVQAQYNPKELSYKKTLSWGAHNPTNGREESAPQGGGSANDRSDLEISSPPERTLSIELLFDGYEQGASIEPQVQILEQLSSLEIVERKDNGEDGKPRAHHCVVAWGGSSQGIRPFPCVITSLTTKYSMWDSNGTPLRATCTVDLKGAVKMAGGVPAPDLQPPPVRSRR